MSQARTEIARMVDGEPMISAAGMALLFGVTTEQAVQLRTQHGTAHLPPDWVKRGRRRAKEAKRWGADSSMLSGLRYWAAKDLGAQLVEDAFGTVWAEGSDLKSHPCSDIESEQGSRLKRGQGLHLTDDQGGNQHER